MNKIKEILGIAFEVICYLIYGAFALCVLLISILGGSISVKINWETLTNLF